MKQLEFTDEKPLEKYRWWDVYDELPDGWVIDEHTGSPMTRTVFITNGKSMISGNQKRALLRVKPKPTVSCQEQAFVKKKVETKVPDDYVFPAKSVNDLARLKFKEQILKEILFDLAVCEIEGWDKKEYINQLQELLNGIKI